MSMEQGWLRVGKLVQAAGVVCASTLKSVLTAVAVYQDTHPRPDCDGLHHVWKS